MVDILTDIFMHVADTEEMNRSEKYCKLLLVQKDAEVPFLDVLKCFRKMMSKQSQKLNCIHPMLFLILNKCKECCSLWKTGFVVTI